MTCLIESFRYYYKIYQYYQYHKKLSEKCIVKKGYNNFISLTNEKRR